MATPDELIPWPRTLHGIRPSTLQLFGMHLVGLRSESTKGTLTLDELAESSKRTVPWHAAVERGELVPTPRQMIKLDRAYGSPTPSLADMLRLLDTEPWGAKAIEIRGVHQLTTPGPFGTTEEDDGPDALFPILDEITRYDRLFVLGPAVLFAAIVTTLFSLDAFSGGGPTPVWPDLKPYLLLGSLAAGFAALIAPGAGLLLTWFATKGRSRMLTRPLKDVRGYRLHDGIRSNDLTVWLQPAELQHMPIAVRSSLRSAGLRAELADRVALVLLMTTALTLGIFAFALSTSHGASPGSTEVMPDSAETAPDSATVTSDNAETPTEPTAATPDSAETTTDPSRDAIWLVVAAALALLATGSLAAAQGAARRFAVYLSVGLGLADEVEFIAGDLPPTPDRERSLLPSVPFVGQINHPGT